MVLYTRMALLPLRKIEREFEIRAVIRLAIHYFCVLLCVRLSPPSIWIDRNRHSFDDALFIMRARIPNSPGRRHLEAGVKELGAMHWDARKDADAPGARFTGFLAPQCAGRRFSSVFNWDAVVLQLFIWRICSMCYGEFLFSFEFCAMRKHNRKVVKVKSCIFVDKILLS